MADTPSVCPDAVAYCRENLRKTSTFLVVEDMNKISMMAVERSMRWISEFIAIYTL